MALSIRYDDSTRRAAFTSSYRLAEQFGLTTYDAAYLELAVRLGADLATNDKELGSAATRLGVVLL